MKKASFITIKAIILLFFISCSEEESDTNEVCTIGNSIIQVDKFIEKLQTTHPGNLPTTRSYEYSYNEYNLLEEKNEYTFDYSIYRKFSYSCGNNIDEVVNDSNSLKYEYTYNEDGKIIAYKTTNSYLHDYTLSYDDRITITGTINKEENTTLILETNSDGLVTKIEREDNYSLFDYDTNGNLIRAKDFDESNTLIRDYEVEYDANPNPFNQQFNSSYIQKFIEYFSDSAFQGIDIFFRFDQFDFPYLKNNPVLLVDKSCTLCYSNLLERTFTYNSENYPIKMEESYVGAPPVVYEYFYK
ncbi:hypothetical protein KO506_01770 [Polaribacter vadi]|uniref:hypothetical protein n=1 Tax=Polaribacter TaxID=52959 RepID=UPI001C09160D|nr:MULTISPECIES: hypothetical protein [Polaribacter]MBU3010126.1 hypothetical protein [Polaribacter vadi]MDO6739933.1 hypothetical protein [Polaribacter sp. 1_MG-2023]